MAKLLLQRPLDSDVLGIHLSDAFTAVSAPRRDGVCLCSNDAITSTTTYPIGSGSEELEARAVVCEDAGLLYAVLSDPKTKLQSLVTCPIATTSSSTKPCSLADTSPRIPLPTGGKAHSLHVLRPTQPQQQPRGKQAPALPSCLAVVLKQGQVAWMLPSSDSLQLNLLPSAASNSHVKAAASSANTLALLTQCSPGSEAHLQLFNWNATALTPLTSTAARCPSTLATATSLSLAPSYALITWSDASVSILPTAPSRASAAPLHLRLSDIMQAAGGEPEQPSSSQPAAAGTPASLRKKRRPGEDPEPSRPRASLVAFDDTQLLAAWTAGASETQGGSSKTALHFVLVDATFGCGVNRGTVLLELPFVPSARCTLIGGSAGALALQVGGAVFSLRLEAPAASLLSLVGKLSLLAPAQSPEAAPAGAVWSMDLKALAAQQQQPAGAAQLSPAPAGALIEREAAAEGRRLQEQLEQHAAAAAATSTSSGLRPEHQQLQQRALDYALQAQQQPIRRLRCELLPTRLLTLLAQDLSRTAQWGSLQQLLVNVPLQGLQGCSGLLAATARAQQYQLLAPLCCKLDEVQPGDVLAALAALLGATTEANLAPRRAYYQHLRAHAEAAVTHAEVQVARSFKSYERREAVAFAQCAAAAVDGFSYREVLLHPLLAVPVDAPGLQSCLGRLDNALVDRLLTYLAKWMEKYAQKLGEGAAAVPLPQELLFPTQTQVLEWVRLVLDAHLARLMMAKGGKPQVGRLARSLKQQLAACQQLLPLLGTAQHIQQQAPLPAAHVAAATQYTVELLDLSIRM